MTDKVKPISINVARVAIIGVSLDIWLTLRTK